MVKYLLDTNVVSELRKRNCNKNVSKWFNSVDLKNLYLSVFSIGEIKKGIVKSKDISKKKVFKSWFEDEILVEFRDRVLDFDLETALFWGELVGKSRSLPAMDSLICAIAMANDLVLVTRNMKDFKKIKGLKIFDPWKTVTSG